MSEKTQRRKRQEFEKKYNVKPEQIGECNDDGKEVFTYNLNQPVWITATRLRLPNGKTVSIDPNEGSYEVYNPNPKKIIIINAHPNTQEHWWQEIVINPDDFAFIPHKYVKPFYGSKTNNTGEQFNVVINTGKRMFIGNKKPDRPEKPKIVK